MEKIRCSSLGTNAKCHTWAEVISWQIRDGEWLSRQPYPRKGSGGLLCGSQLNVSQRGAAARGTDSTVGVMGRHTAWRAHRRFSCSAWSTRCSASPSSFGQSLRPRIRPTWPTRQGWSNWSYFAHRLNSLSKFSYTNNDICQRNTILQWWKLSSSRIAKHWLQKSQMLHYQHVEDHATKHPSEETELTRPWVSSTD